MKIAKNEQRYVTQPILDYITKTDYKRKDDLYCIIDLIYRRQIYFKTELQRRYGYIEIPRSSFQKLIPSPNYIREALDFLVENGLIKRNDFYQYGTISKAKGYKIMTEYLGSKVPVEITDSKINKRIKEIKLNNRKKRVKNLEFFKSKYYKNFKIDFDAAMSAITENAISEISELCKKIKYDISDKRILELIECRSNTTMDRIIITQRCGYELNNILHRLMVHQQQVYAIHDGYLFFKRNKTNGRLDTNLTSLPSYLRKFLKSDEKLFSLDIKNSQPFFLYTKLQNEIGINKDELELYGELAVNGVLYEYLANDFFGIDYDSLDDENKVVYREKSKINLFRILYSKVESYLSIKEVFAEKFPTIMKYINQVNFKKNNTLAVLLQERESLTVLDMVMVRLQEKNINPFTIHDSFLVTESELSVVRETLVSVCIEMYGIAPQLHEKDLLEEKMDSEEDYKFIDDGYDLPESFF
ncbi:MULTISPECIES: hypothetical protein [Flavobacterium]|uniref:DNA-directed RNA polymerase n=2 Tax=Flavobacterium hankyongi TaxID=1176532 RepID=A0ABP9A9W3_9FLAO|nr:hypothetical protein [Flavobacterium sp. N1846]